MAPRARKPVLTPTQVIVLSFLLAALGGGLLLCLPMAARGKLLDPIDALFMSTTSVCVTGLVTVDTGGDLTTFGHLIILCLIQIGGLGYMVLSTAFMVLMGQRVQLRHRLVLSQAMGESRLGQINNLLSTVIAFTFVCEFLGAVALMLLFRRYGTPWGTAAWLGVFHSVSAFCNAGLDLFGLHSFSQYFPAGTGSLTSFVKDPWVSLVVSALIVAGGIGFVVALDVVHAATGPRTGRRRRLSLHSKIVLSATAVLIVMGTVVYLVLEWDNPATLGALPLHHKLFAALFQSITPRTAGFNTIPQGALYPASQLFTTFLMFVGASPGGTGGGIKTTTFLVLILAAAASVRGDDEVRCFKRRIGVDAVFRSLAVMFFMALVICGTTFLFGVFERNSLTHMPGAVVQHQFVEYFFEATSALGTVGLSTGLTSTLTPMSKLLLIVGMLFGRIGPVTIAMALVERKRRYYLKHPIESVMIG